MEKCVELGVVARPGRMMASLPSSPQIIHQIAVRVEHTDSRNLSWWERLLPAGFAQQALRGEDRSSIVVLVRENRWVIKKPCLRVVVSGHIHLIRIGINKPYRVAMASAMIHREAFVCAWRYASFLCRQTGELDHSLCSSLTAWPDNDFR